MSLHLSFLHLLSLWIIITYHTGLITASKRVSMKTLITMLGAEHSALIHSPIRMKRNSWEKQETKPSSETILSQEIYAVFEHDQHLIKTQCKFGLSDSAAVVNGCSWSFAFVLQKHCTSFSAVITVSAIPRGKFYSNKMASFKYLKDVSGHFFLARAYTGTGTNAAWILVIPCNRIYIRSSVCRSQKGENTTVIILFALFFVPLLSLFQTNMKKKWINQVQTSVHYPCWKWLN